MEGLNVMMNSSNVLENPSSYLHETTGQQTERNIVISFVAKAEVVELSNATKNSVKGLHD